MLCRGIDVMDLLITLTTKQGVVLLNSTQVRRLTPACGCLYCAPCEGCFDRLPALCLPAHCLPPCLPA